MAGHYDDRYIYFSCSRIVVRMRESFIALAKAPPEQFVDFVIRLRNAFRKAEDYKTADAIRDILNKHGIELEDHD